MWVIFVLNLEISFVSFKLGLIWKISTNFFSKLKISSPILWLRKLELVRVHVFLAVLPDIVLADLPYKLLLWY